MQRSLTRERKQRGGQAVLTHRLHTLPLLRTLGILQGQQTPTRADLRGQPLVGMRLPQVKVAGLSLFLLVARALMTSSKQGSSALRCRVATKIEAVNA